MNNEKHNGWTNYSTWRVNLEVFDGTFPNTNEEINTNEDYTADFCRVYTEETIENDFPNSNETCLAEHYALAFIDDVNWQEIAEHLNEQQSFDFSEVAK